LCATIALHRHRYGRYAHVRPRKGLEGAAAWSPSLRRGTWHLRHAHAFSRLDAPPAETWWERPGWGNHVSRSNTAPAGKWDRDYEEFNPSMLDEGGEFKFNGPYCRAGEMGRAQPRSWELITISWKPKWHDGICFFDTALTDWRSDEELRRGFLTPEPQRGHPLHVLLFEHLRPQSRFDNIQPDRRHTFSILALGGQPIYEEYLLGNTGSWLSATGRTGCVMDWYWPGDGSDAVTFDFLQGQPFPASPWGSTSPTTRPVPMRRSDYTIGEATTSTDRWSACTRRGRCSPRDPTVPENGRASSGACLDHPWELIAPAGRWWQDPDPRPDPDDLPAHGRHHHGQRREVQHRSHRTDGRERSSPPRSISCGGWDWYRSRRLLFADCRAPGLPGVPGPAGLKVSPRGFKCIASRRGDDDPESTW